MVMATPATDGADKPEADAAGDAGCAGGTSNAASCPCTQPEQGSACEDSALTCTYGGEEDRVLCTGKDGKYRCYAPFI
ncbi:MAG: hypothetical protein QM778_07345 [Myxococcales bacterium]